MQTRSLIKQKLPKERTLSAVSGTFLEQTGGINDRKHLHSLEEKWLRRHRFDLCVLTVNRYVLNCRQRDEDSQQIAYQVFLNETHKSRALFQNETVLSGSQCSVRNSC
jgi:hypothetical protein